MPAVFYPGAKVRFQIRFEDFLARSPLPSTAIAEGAEAFGLGIQTDVPPGPFKAVGFDIVPYTCSVELNSYRKADTCRIAIPLQKLPFDPRIIRSATVQVFGGCFTPQEYAEAMGAVDAAAIQLPDTIPLGRPTSGLSNEIFRGFVDDWEMTLEGHDVLSVTARDSTSLLLDAEAPPNSLRDIPAVLTLDQVIGQILFGDGNPLASQSRRFGLPGARGIRIVNEATEPTALGLAAIAAGEAGNRPGEREPLPTLAEIRPPSYLTSKKTAAKGRKKSPGTGQKVKYWDVITDLCVSAGLICFMRPGITPIPAPGGKTVLPAAELVISRPRTYYQKSGSAGEAFVDRTKIRAFTYGSNVNSISIRRSVSGNNVPDGVLVKAFDVTKGKTIEERYPPGPTVTRPAASGIGDREELKVFELDEVSGPRTSEILVNAAKSIYEQLGRGEMEVTVRTKHLSGLIQNIDEGIEADLFQLRPGDPMRVEVAQALVEEGQVSAYTLFTAASDEQRIAAMVEQGISRPIATMAAQAMSNDFIQREFRTQRVMVSWNYQSGWEFEVHGINYLDVRNATDIVDGTLLTPADIGSIFALGLDF